MNIDILLLDTPFGLTCPWWWLWSLGAFILGILVSCFIFGWCRYGRRIGELEAERDQYHLQFTDMEKQYMGLKYQIEEATKDNTALRASLNKCESDKTVLKVKLDRLAAQAAEAAEASETVGARGMAMGAELPVEEVSSKTEKAGKQAAGLSNNPEDLKIIEGIGPKIEGLLKEAGIKTWSDLAAASQERLQEILDKAGDRYRLADPGTWPQQAEMAAAGKWSELSAYQNLLKGGKDPDQ